MWIISQPVYLQSIIKLLFSPTLVLNYLLALIDNSFYISNDLWESYSFADLFIWLINSSILLQTLYIEYKIVLNSS